MTWAKTKQVIGGAIVTALVLAFCGMLYTIEGLEFILVFGSAVGLTLLLALGLALLDGTL